MDFEFDPHDIDARERDEFHVEELRWGDDPRDIDDREREFERDRDSRDHDPREPFLEGLELPRYPERELVYDERENLYELNREDSLMLSTIGAFRVVAERDLMDFHDAERTLDHLRDEGLIHTVHIDAGQHADALTERGLSVLEASRRERDDDPRDRDDDDRQTFHAGVARERELQHDADLFRAYREVERDLRDRGGEVERIVLEVDLRREYQQWLQEHNRGRSDSDGRPDRTEREIADWAHEHELPYRDGGVQFPDFRIEYELDGRDRHEDVEVVTGHYRGAHAAGRAQSGFRCVRGGGSSHGSSPFDPHGAEDFRAKHGRDLTGVTTPDLTMAEAAKKFRSARYQALERLWLQDGYGAVLGSTSHTLKEHWQLGRGRVEVVVLPHQYLQLTSLVGVA